MTFLLECLLGTSNSTCPKLNLLSCLHSYLIPTSPLRLSSSLNGPQLPISVPVHNLGIIMMPFLFTPTSNQTSNVFGSISLGSSLHVSLASPSYWWFNHCHAMIPPPRYPFVSILVLSYLFSNRNQKVSLKCISDYIIFYSKFF